MKIFNWIHRKLHSKDGSNIGDVKKMKRDEQHDTQALLVEQVALADVIDTWRQGILSIGTFGFDPLKDFTAQQKRIQLIIANREEVEEDEEFEEDLAGEGEQNPLVLNAFKHGCNNDDICSDIHGQSEITLASDDDHSDEEREYKNNERITLADLFSAYSDHHMDVTKPTHHDHHKLPPVLAVAIKIKINPEEEEGEGEPAHAKPKLSFAKKLIPPPLLKDDRHPRPIKKIHRMMTRILKRKIHPELGGTKQNKENHCENIGANQTLSLLQNRDVIACT